MTETVVENKTCPTCSTNVPANAIFCYHCGNSIKPEELSSNDNVSDVWLRGDMTKPVKSDTSSEEISNESYSTTENYSDDASENQIPNEKPEEDLVDQKESKKTELQSAASLKVNAKKLPSREIKVRWEEYDNAPNLLFLVGGILLVVFSIVVYFLAMYLR
jgi:hypothetical protein